jgi:hypothetical protein
MKKEFRYCGYCANGTPRRSGPIQCGAQPIIPDILNEKFDTSPLWAIRKFASIGALVKVREAGMHGGSIDPLNMNFNDGKNCPLWKKRP